MFEIKLLKDFPREIIAVDEVGRSPLSGPVVIGALRVKIDSAETWAHLVRSLRRQGVKDSKLLTHTARAQLLSKFKISSQDFKQKGEFHWKGLTLSHLTWDMSHEIIERENIFEASMRGMKEAAMNLLEGPPENATLLIDGPLKLRWKDEAPLSWQEMAIVQGDVKSTLIGLAAIIAKEKRDAFMREMDELYPQYGFKTNFGYPTKEHREAIAVHGPCPIHRKTFGKVKEFIRTELVG